MGYSPKQAATQSRRAALAAAKRLAAEQPNEGDKQLIREALKRGSRSFQVAIAAELGVPTTRLNTYLAN